MQVLEPCSGQLTNLREPGLGMQERAMRLLTSIDTVNDLDLC